MRRKTTKEILEEYCREMGQPYPAAIEDIMISVVARCREDEPRLNSGVNLIDYMSISDEDDVMDSVYGPE